MKIVFVGSHLVVAIIKLQAHARKKVEYQCFVMFFACVDFNSSLGKSKTNKNFITDIVNNKIRLSLPLNTNFVEDLLLEGSFQFNFLIIYYD